MSETATEISIFERIGGAVTLDRLVEAFYGHMDKLPEAKKIRDMHDFDLGPVKVVLKRYLSEWTGGPKLYSPEKGHPRLRQRHMRFPIGNADRDAWLTCMRKALAETVADPAARAELDANMTKLADWMRNQADNPHDRGEARPT
ncbi:group II truncated hemoglobin [uncultured Rhodoblastus sp.]|uniref:group II truncated hemoglobin n=1 Tax=uncultured Rhodoblastus sp. TaxID=543037 RepID=UPI0025D3E88A|nr:group II truncated hemoglobin [uncultured Rhodoblastus sp.]